MHHLAQQAVASNVPALRQGAETYSTESDSAAWSY